MPLISLLSGNTLDILHTLQYSIYVGDTNRIPQGRKIQRVIYF
jgi:hypothetical protein